MPSWVKDDAKWERAKEIAKKEYGGAEDDKFWRIVAGIYKKMGGEVMHKSIIFLKGHVAGYLRKDGTYVQPHENGRSSQMHPAFAHDMELQAQWLTARAKEAGFDSVDDLLTRDPEQFAKLAEGWRAEHPHMAKAIADRLDALRARRSDLPSVGQTIEFANDRFTDKGPATGKVAEVRGSMVHVDFGGDTQVFSWRMLQDCARLSENGVWMIKALSAKKKRRKFPIAYRQKWHGLELAIENPVGTTRSGKKPDGTEWHTTMAHAYGEISGTNGVDGDPVDIFLGPDLDTAPMVYVVHQKTVDDWDKYDEDKCMLGFSSEGEARSAFLQNYDDPRFLGPITAMPVAEFVEKVRATHDKPAMIKGIDMSKVVLFLKAHGSGKPPMPGKVIKEDGKDKIVEDLDGLISEHEHLVGVLEKDKDAAAQHEAREEGAELKGLKRKKVAASKGAPMTKSIALLKAQKLSTSMRKKIGTVGSEHREDMPEDVFLEPASRKYPVKVKTDGQWAYSPKLLEAAAARARMQGRADLAKRADDIRARL
jgi:hypothetical protein